MSTTARKARKRLLNELRRHGHAAPEVLTFRHPEREATPIAHRLGFWQQPMAVIKRELEARGTKMTDQLMKSMEANEKGRRLSLRQRGAYVRNYGK